MINLNSPGHFWKANERPDKYIEIYNYFKSIIPNFFESYDSLYKMIQNFYYIPIEEIKEGVDYLINNQYITIIC